jgi:hypothetical protein
MIVDWTLPPTTVDLGKHDLLSLGIGWKENCNVSARKGRFREPMYHLNRSSNKSFHLQFRAAEDPFTLAGHRKVIVEMSDEHSPPTKVLLRFHNCTDKMQSEKCNSRHYILILVQSKDLIRILTLYF